jgi:Tfp pilus assembly protein FimT
MKMSKKGFQLTEVPQLVIVLLVIAIVLGVGATVLTQVRSTQTTGSAAYNITGQGLQGQTDLSEWQTTWVSA